VIGESFAEIFFGNSAMIGMPCVTAAAADVQAIAERVEKNPEARVHVDLVALTCEVDGFRCAVSMPAKTREAFTSGAWDTTGMLLENFDQVQATAAALPYVSGF
jgi:3-isopropylmalate/(R)-2-methylmalate dehydratase small subunit